MRAPLPPCSGLRGLAELQGERVRAVEHPHPADLQRPHVRESVRHGTRVAAHVGGGAGLVEIERRKRRVAVGESGFLEIDGEVADAATLERFEERLLPLRVLEQDGDIGAEGHLQRAGKKAIANPTRISMFAPMRKASTRSDSPAVNRQRNKWPYSLRQY